MGGNANSGRKPKPTALRVVDGIGGVQTSRLNSVKENEPKPAKAARPPSAPSHLAADAKAEWTTLAKILHPIGLLTKADYGLFEQYCVAMARWKKAEKQVRELGEVMIDQKRNIPIDNPWLKVASKAHEQVRKIAPEFGLSPSARAKIGSIAPPEELEKPGNMWAGLIPGQR